MWLSWWAVLGEHGLHLPLLFSFLASSGLFSPLQAVSAFSLASGSSPATNTIGQHRISDRVRDNYLSGPSLPHFQGSQFLWFTEYFTANDTGSLGDLSPLEVHLELHGWIPGY